MKLYVSPGACSMSCHIAFEEAKLPFEAMISQTEEVQKLNPMGAVPTLVMNDGKVLTQNIAILTYAANQPTGTHLLPKAGTFEYAKAYQWLSFVASDLHPSFSPLFNPATPEEQRKAAVERVIDLFNIADAALKDSKYIAGNEFTIADAYLFTVYGWSAHVKLDTSSFTHLNAFKARVFERPAVQAVMKREGLLK
jgi:glutathione S-transferase